MFIFFLALFCIVPSILHAMKEVTQKTVLPLSQMVLNSLAHDILLKKSEPDTYLKKHCTHMPDELKADLVYTYSKQGLTFRAKVYLVMDCVAWSLNSQAKHAIFKEWVKQKAAKALHGEEASKDDDPKVLKTYVKKRKQHC